MALININRWPAFDVIKPCAAGITVAAGAAMMNAGWKIVLLAAIVFAAAFGAERLLVPDVVPVGLAEESQPVWSLELAFVLRAVELMAAGLAALALAVMIGAWVRSWLRPGTS